MSDSRRPDAPASPDSDAFDLAQMIEENNHLFIHMGKSFDQVRLKEAAGKAARTLRNLILIVIDDRRYGADTRKGLVTISQAALGKLSYIKERAARDHVRILEERGFLTTVRRGCKQTGPSTYVIHFRRCLDFLVQNLFARRHANAAASKQTGKKASRCTWGTFKKPSTSGPGADSVPDEEAEDGRRRFFKKKERRRKRPPEPYKAQKKKKRYPKSEHKGVWRAMNNARAAENSTLIPHDIRDDIVRISNGCKEFIEQWDLSEPKNAPALEYIQKLLRMGAKPETIISRVKRQTRLTEDALFCYTPAVKGTLKSYKIHLERVASQRRNREVAQAAEAERQAQREKMSPAEREAEKAEIEALFGRYRKVSDGPKAPSSEASEASLSREEFDAEIAKIKAEKAAEREASRFKKVILK